MVRTPNESHVASPLLIRPVSSEHSPKRPSRPRTSAYFIITVREEVEPGDLRLALQRHFKRATQPLEAERVTPPTAPADLRGTVLPQPAEAALTAAAEAECQTVQFLVGQSFGGDTALGAAGGLALMRAQAGLVAALHGEERLHPFIPAPNLRDDALRAPASAVRDLSKRSKITLVGRFPPLAGGVPRPPRTFKRGAGAKPIAEWFETITREGVHYVLHSRGSSKEQRSADQSLYDGYQTYLRWRADQRLWEAMRQFIICVAAKLLTKTSEKDSFATLLQKFYCAWVNNTAEAGLLQIYASCRLIVDCMRPGLTFHLVEIGLTHNSSGDAYTATPGAVATIQGLPGRTVDGSPDFAAIITTLVRKANRTAGEAKQVMHVAWSTWQTGQGAQRPTPAPQTPICAVGLCALPPTRATEPDATAAQAPALTATAGPRSATTAAEQAAGAAPNATPTDGPILLLDYGGSLAEALAAALAAGRSIARYVYAGQASSEQRLMARAHIQALQAAHPCALPAAALSRAFTAPAADIAELIRQHAPFPIVIVGAPTAAMQVDEAAHQVRRTSGYEPTIIIASGGTGGRLKDARVARSGGNPGWEQLCAPAIARYGGSPITMQHSLFEGALKEDFTVWCNDPVWFSPHTPPSLALAYDTHLRHLAQPAQGGPLCSAALERAIGFMPGATAHPEVEPGRRNAALRTAPSIVALTAVFRAISPPIATKAQGRSPVQTPPYARSLASGGGGDSGPQGKNSIKIRSARRNRVRSGALGAGQATGGGQAQGQKGRGATRGH